MRKEVPEIGWGDFTVLKVRDPAVLALRYDWRNNSVLFLHNLHEQPREILVDPGVNSEQGKLLVNLLAEDHSRANKSGKHRIMLEGYGYRWYRIGGLDYLLRRTDIAHEETDAVRNTNPPQKSGQGIDAPGRPSHPTFYLLLGAPGRRALPNCHSTHPKR